MGKDEAVCLREPGIERRLPGLSRALRVLVVLLFASALCRGGEDGESGFDLRERYWGEFYGQAEYSRHDRNNVLGDIWTKHGLHLVKVGDSWFDAYVKARLYVDRNADFWNNRTEGAIGVRYRPFQSAGLFLFAEWIEGRYTGREGRDENLDDDAYSDFQAGFTFWQYWGKEHWQTGDGWHFYAPFRGWREVYADGIFFRRDGRNAIATLDYKEGLLLAKVGDVRLDGYLSFQGGVDRNGDFWNNYVKAGPGFRVRPFEAFDLSVGCEYLFCHSWRGERVEEPGSYRDVAVTVAFWKGF